MPALHKILIANRGEIARRVIRTARDLGYRTVAVYSDADADALHVIDADEAVHIGAAAVGESYLLGERIIEAARKTGADAVHPGYGFLSENADFARACEQAGLTFIGPRADAIELMGSKRLSKLAMIEACVPCIPGYQDADQSDETLLEKAIDIGFPLMVKASAGGGGRGMRLVHSTDELPEQLRTARSEALSAFGSDELILERAVLEPRHIEIQVFADEQGNVIYLGERDCSIQRRHQKVVEEAPSPFVNPALRQRMGEAAVQAAKACDYRGAGTVEFLVDEDEQFYFLEMNTRLQVEHPVTELVTGLDLVALQLRVAEGMALPLSQDEVRLTGHAVEVRLYAEDPRKAFMPQTGEVLAWSYPERDGVRMDHGILAGQQISPFYDPMLAKAIGYGESREIAIRRLVSALEDTCLLGLNNNKRFLQNVLRHQTFAEGHATTAFIEEHFINDPSMDDQGPNPLTLAQAAMLFMHRASAASKPTFDWRNTGATRATYRLSHNGDVTDVLISRDAAGFNIDVLEQRLILEPVQVQNNGCDYLYEGVRRRLDFAFDGDSLFLDSEQGHFNITDATYQPAQVAGSAGSGQVKASMDGAVVSVLVREGDSVTEGQTLVVLEAMKMEHPLKAGINGTVTSVQCQPGQQVKTRQLLAVVEGDDAEGTPS